MAYESIRELCNINCFENDKEVIIVKMNPYIFCHFVECLFLSLWKCFCKLLNKRLKVVVGINFKIVPDVFL